VRTELARDEQSAATCPSSVEVRQLQQWRRGNAARHTDKATAPLRLDVGPGAQTIKQPAPGPVSI